MGEPIDEAVMIQGHTTRFATIDLGGPATEIHGKLLTLTLPIEKKYFDVDNDSVQNKM